MSANNNLRNSLGARNIESIARYAAVTMKVPLPDSDDMDGMLYAVKLMYLEESKRALDLRGRQIEAEEAVRIWREAYDMIRNMTTGTKP